MPNLLRCELICAAAHYDFWLSWLLENHTETIDVTPIKRFGVDVAQLTRSEQVKGYADYYRFNLTLSAALATAFKATVQQQTHPIEVSLLALLDT